MLGYNIDNKEVDHINHIRTDNRSTNLRIVTRQENCRNSSLSNRNTSGHIGVSWNSRYNGWAVVIKQKIYCIYDDQEKAFKKADEMYEKLGYHENHGK
jgi:hypothetical protein